MEPNARFRANVRAFYAYLGSLGVAGVAPIVAGKLVESPSVAARVAGVVIGVGGWLPLMSFTAWAIRRGDEFSRRMHLVAIAWAFAIGLIMIALTDVLVRAHFIEPPPYMILWLAMAIVWVVCLFATKRSYERAE